MTTARGWDAPPAPPPVPPAPPPVEPPPPPRAPPGPPNHHRRLSKDIRQFASLRRYFCRKRCRSEAAVPLSVTTRHRPCHPAWARSPTEPLRPYFSFKSFRWGGWGLRAWAARRARPVLLKRLTARGGVTHGGRTSRPRGAAVAAARPTSPQPPPPTHPCPPHAAPRRHGQVQARAGRAVRGVRPPPRRAARGGGGYMDGGRGGRTGAIVGGESVNDVFFCCALP